jgi:GNAT superfamily N-acetyltransferase
MIIRLATPDDLNDIMRMAVDFFDAAGLAAITEIDTLSVINTVEHLMADEHAVVLVAEIDDSLVGMAGALAFPFYFNRNHLTCQELFWWVDPSYRAEGTGKALLHSLENWAQRLGASSISMISLHQVDGERVGKLYKHAGYTPSEQSYIRRFEYGH